MVACRWPATCIPMWTHVQARLASRSLTSPRLTSTPGARPHTAFGHTHPLEGDATCNPTADGQASTAEPQTVRLRPSPGGVPVAAAYGTPAGLMFFGCTLPRVFGELVHFITCSRWGLDLVDRTDQLADLRTKRSPRTRPKPPRARRPALAPPGSPHGLRLLPT